jgi:hypothetical protein
MGPCVTREIEIIFDAYGRPFEVIILIDTRLVHGSLYPHRSDALSLRQCPIMT